jgi:hypothetical protein
MLHIWTTKPTYTIEEMTREDTTENEELKYAANANKDGNKQNKILSKSSDEACDEDSEYDWGSDSNDEFEDAETSSFMENCKASFSAADFSYEKEDKNDYNF